MDEPTLAHALGVDIPKTPAQLEAIAQAMTEITDELDGLSSRLALTARALTGTIAALRRSAQLAEDERRAAMSTRERLQDDKCDQCGNPGTRWVRGLGDAGDGYQVTLCRSCAQLDAVARAQALERERLAEDAIARLDGCARCGADVSLNQNPLCDGCAKTDEETIARAGDVVALRAIEDPDDEYCIDCGEYLEESEAWLCTKCEATARDQARHEAEADRGTEGASAASGAATGAPAPLDTDRGRP